MNVRTLRSVSECLHRRPGGDAPLGVSGPRGRSRRQRPAVRLPGAEEHAGRFVRDVPQRRHGEADLAGRGHARREPLRLLPRGVRARQEGRPDDAEPVRPRLPRGRALGSGRHRPGGEGLGWRRRVGRGGVEGGHEPGRRLEQPGAARGPLAHAHGRRPEVARAASGPGALPQQHQEPIGRRVPATSAAWSSRTCCRPSVCSPRRRAWTCCRPTATSGRSRWPS